MIVRREALKEVRRKEARVVKERRTTKQSERPRTNREKISSNEVLFLSSSFFSW